MTKTRIRSLATLHIASPRAQRTARAALQRDCPWRRYAHQMLEAWAEDPTELYEGEFSDMLCAAGLLGHSDPRFWPARYHDVVWAMSRQRSLEPGRRAIDEQLAFNRARRRAS